VFYNHNYVVVAVVVVVYRFGLRAGSGGGGQFHGGEGVIRELEFMKVLTD
jgi:5-oxoprolinase (ATP-hydrolysing)